jgi:phospholipase C
MERGLHAGFALVFASALIVAATGCGAGSASAAQPSTGVSSVPSGGEPTGRNGIAHVVIIIQENRSFDNLFAGYPGADTASVGTTHDGRRVPLQPVSLTSSVNVEHQLRDFLAAYDCAKMDGFDLEVGSVLGAYSYVPRSEVQQYWDMAGRYALADKMFASQIDMSFTAHQFLIAGQGGGVVDGPSRAPWGCDAPPGTIISQLQPGRTVGGGVFPCFSYRTLADELDARGISWRYYAPAVNGDVGGQAWSAYDAISQVRYGPDWSAHVISPETSVLSDIPRGSLASVTWIVPSWHNSDHSLSRSASGPDWVTSIVDAIGKSSYWSSTAIFIVWDDWGGWFDHVPPPQLDLYGLGIRVPLIVVSPFAKRGYVSHVQYEFGSILKFVESTYGLAPLAASDTRANALDDCFDFKQAPRSFESVATRRSPADFLSASPSDRAPDSD